MGDDGIGIELLKKISRRKLPDNVSLEEGSTGGMLLLGLIEDYDMVLVVDAMDTGDKTNDIVIFSPSQIKEDQENTLSLHSASIMDIVKFSKAIGGKVPDIMIFGIQVREVKEYIGLSSELKRMFDTIEERLYKYILELCNENSL